MKMDDLDLNWDSSISIGVSWQTSMVFHRSSLQQRHITARGVEGQNCSDSQGVCGVMVIIPNCGMGALITL